jgi:DNA-binding NtrC family response regulator
VIVAAGRRIEETDLPIAISAAVEVRRNSERPKSLAELEEAHIRHVLVTTSGNKSESARILGISRKNLYEKIARYRL